MAVELDRVTARDSSSTTGSRETHGAIGYYNPYTGQLSEYMLPNVDTLLALGFNAFGGHTPMRFIENLTVMFDDEHLAMSGATLDRRRGRFIESGWMLRANNIAFATNVASRLYRETITPTELPVDLLEVITDTRTQVLLARMSATHPSIIEALRWLFDTIEQRSDAGLMKVEMDQTEGLLPSISVHLLMSQDQDDDWYERAESLELEWLARYPDFERIALIVPWPERRHG